MEFKIQNSETFKDFLKAYFLNRKTCDFINGEFMKKKSCGFDLMHQIFKDFKITEFCSPTKFSEFLNTTNIQKSPTILYYKKISETFLEQSSFLNQIQKDNDPPKILSCSFSNQRFEDEIYRLYDELSTKGRCFKMHWTLDSCFKIFKIFFGSFIWNQIFQIKTKNKLSALRGISKIRF